MTEGIKLDEGKVRLDLIPTEAVMSIGRGLTEGHKKYGPRNWEQGMDWGRVYGAAQRHLWKWWSGIDIDEETGLSHLDCAIVNLAFLITYQSRGIGKDDRPQHKEQELPVESK